MKKKRKIVCSVIFILCFGMFLFFFSSSKNGLKEDYYEEINREILKKNPIKEGEYTWSTFQEAQDKVDQEVEMLVEGVIQGNLSYVDSNVSRMFRSFYNKAMDQEERDQLGVIPLQDYFQQIFACNSLSSLLDVIYRIEKELGISILTHVVVDRDYEDSSSNMVYFYPVSFVFGVSVDYFVDPDYMAYRAYMKRAVIQLLETYGYSKSEARASSDRLMNFYEDVGRNSKLKDELGDVSSYYHKVTLEEFQEVYSSIDVSDYLKNLGIEAEEYYSLVDEGEYEKLNQYFTLSNLDLWKEHLFVMILSHYAIYLGNDYVEIVTHLEQDLLGVEQVLEEDSKQVIEMMTNLFSEEIDWAYYQKEMTKEKEEYIQKMFLDIQKHYKSMLQQNEWLQDDTKKKAISKLEAMEIHVGLDDGNPSFGKNYVTDYDICKEGNLVDCVKEVVRIRRNVELERLGNQERKRLVSENVVNAYYSPMDNAIYVPTAILQLVDFENSYYENLGTMGMILAHEVTHGFDANGSRFDINGNFANWWTDQDWVNFEKLKVQVQDYYSRYEVLPGRFLNGKITVNENIADLGAVQCIVGIARDQKAFEEDYRTLFSSFAKLWASQSVEEYTKLLLLQDTHAPSKYRVNAVLSSIDEFYQVYDIYFWNSMYVRQDKRVQVW